MHCPSCGKTIPDESAFCLQCGKPIPSATGEAKKTNPLETIWKIFAALVVIIGAIFLFVYISNRKSPPSSTNPLNAIMRIPLRLHRVTIGTGALTVAAEGFVYYTLSVPPSATQVNIQGRFSATGGGGNDIEVYVLSQDEFINWKNGHPAQTFYNSGKVTVGTLNVTLPNGAGSYYLVFNNRFSLLTPKAVQEDITLSYDTP
jgi:predicted nucleic acid-binding Zn ribbon protein